MDVPGWLLDKISFVRYLSVELIAMTSSLVIWSIVVILIKVDYF